MKTRIKPLKTDRKLARVKLSCCEEKLFKKQLDSVYKSGKRFEAMAYREDVEHNEELQNEIKAALQKNMERKEKLLKV